MKSVLNWETNGSPSKSFNKGELKTKSIDIADSQNEYFIEKIRNLRIELPQQTDDPSLFLMRKLRNIKCSMKFSPVHPDEILKIISELSNSAAFGLDNIDTYIIKLIRHEITPVLTHIINLSLTKRTW